MTTATLFLIVVAVAGVSSMRWATRLAPLPNEFPAKTLLAAVAAAVVAYATYGAWRAPTWLLAATLVLTPLFVFGPVALLALVRAGAWRVARVLNLLLYWTAGGRAAVGRLLAQAALQRGEGEAALALTTRHDPVLLGQAYLLSGDYQKVLELEQPPSAWEADNAHLLAAARIEALLALGHVEQARHETANLKTRFEAGKQGPLGFRAVVLSQARLAAREGDFDGARSLLEQPLAGVTPATLYDILGTAAERGGRPSAAVKAYAAAYMSSSGTQRTRYAARLRALGATPPTSAATLARRPLATYLLAAVIASAYLAQVLADKYYGVLSVRGQGMHASSIVAAFVQGIPGVPDAGAWWRFLTYAFLHGSILHIGLNLWVLFDIGRLYERRRSWGDLLAAFTAGTALGAVATTVFQAGQQLVLVGASGGILGVAGALLAEAALSRAPSDRLLLRGLLQWVALLIVFSVAVPGVSLWGHVGGLVGGFLYGVVRLRSGLGRRFAQATGWFCVGLLLLAIVSAITSVGPHLP
ncbi:MAG TPA: rhomboid family intramembrane serine protease [Trueperaceae bacterium]|nr:rhomboid family intramembrane serine protease [Trueperaceae bacterium]